MIGRRFLSGIILSSLACAWVPVQPAWFSDGLACEQPLPNGARRFCASVLADDAESARTAVIAAALVHAASEIETEVQAKLEIDTNCVSVTSDGAVSSNCRESVQSSTRTSTGKLSFRDAKVEQFATAKEAGKTRAWATVLVSASEWKRVVRAARGKLFVAVDCRVGSDPCQPSVIDALATTFSGCGVSPTAGIVTDVTTLDEAVKRALAVEAGKALFVSLRTVDRGKADGLVSAEGSGKWELVDTGDGKTLRARGIPAKSAVGVTAAAATASAFKGLIERLSTRSCGLSDASGSICCSGDGKP